MLTPLALLSCIIFIIWAISRRSRDRAYFFAARWIPLSWLLIVGSRPLSYWLAGGTGSGESWIDKLFYLILFVSAILVLYRRKFSCFSLIVHNKALALLYAYLLLTAIWSELPSHTVRSWVRDLSAILMGMIVLTDPDPEEAITSIFYRCALILFPFSIIFIKFFPGIGRAASASGGNTFTGVTTQKNSLGEIVLVFGLVVIWDIIEKRNWRINGKSNLEFLPHLSLLFMGSWLLLVCDSKTAIICLILGSAILLNHKLPVLKHSPKRMLFVGFILLPLALALEATFPVYTTILQWLGRDPTLTNRTEIWEALKQHPVDPLIGVGYLAYWDVYKTVTIEGYDALLRTAHNGYIEIYLDGGWIALSLLIFMLLAVGVNVTRSFMHNFPIGRLRFAVYTVMLFYNFSESMYARRSPLWFAFLLFCMETPILLKENYRPILENERRDPKPIRVAKPLAM